MAHVLGLRDTLAATRLTANTHAATLHTGNALAQSTLTGNLCSPRHQRARGKGLSSAREINPTSVKAVIKNNHCTCAACTHSRHDPTGFVIQVNAQSLSIHKTDESKSIRAGTV